MEAFAGRAGYRLDPLAVQVTRLELYTQRKDRQDTVCFVPLSALGTQILQANA